MFGIFSDSSPRRLKCIYLFQFRVHATCTHKINFTFYIFHLWNTNFQAQMVKAVLNGDFVRKMDLAGFEPWPSIKMLLCFSFSHLLSKISEVELGRYRFNGWLSGHPHFLLVIHYSPGVGTRYNGHYPATRPILGQWVQFQFDNKNYRAFVMGEGFNTLHFIVE